MNSFLEKVAKLLTIFLLSFLKCGECSVSSNEYMKREHSLIRPFQGVGINLPYWDFLGHTMVTSNYIRLTPDLQSKSGALWNFSPVMTRNWEIHVTFKVHGKGTELYGDGLAIWYTKERMQPGPVFGSKDYFSGLAVILDTYSNHNGPHNHQHPYLSAMINNGTWTYDHDRDGTHTQLAGCEVRFRNVNYDTHVSIRYENDVLSISTDMENKREWKNCFVVNDVELPTGYFLGLSATTGDLSDSHDVLGVKFYDLDINVTPEDIAARSSIIPRAKTYEPPREHKDDPKPGMSNAKIFFILLFGMIFTIGAAIFAISYFKGKNSRKRFY
ncbi:vesicular integral-membrane protein VIP36 [Ceratitis capitata]|uniref:VIP36-like protein n=1 Tax=Ceratitis capitata TaxID=7213 RepID=W8C7A9_CERCA|nr:vesicular integral-membrane protein VIP36 [Ceratitis capitata]